MRIASITKPITAAAVMLLADERLVSLDDPIARWLPELESPQVVRTPESAIDDLVPAARPVTVEDLLTSRAGWGFPSDFSFRPSSSFSETSRLRAAREPGRVARNPCCSADAPPAGRSVA